MVQKAKGDEDKNSLAIKNVELAGCPERAKGEIENGLACQSFITYEMEQEISHSICGKVEKGFNREKGVQSEEWRAGCGRGKE